MCAGARIQAAMAAVSGEGGRAAATPGARTCAGAQRAGIEDRAIDFPVPRDRCRGLDAVAALGPRMAASTGGREAGWGRPAGQCWDRSRDSWGAAIALRCAAPRLREVDRESLEAGASRRILKMASTSHRGC
jgi:hypothetical protein